MMLDFLRNNPALLALTDAEIAAECNAVDWIAGEIWRINVLIANTGELAKLVIVGQDANMPAELRAACLTAVHVVTSAQIQHIDTTNEAYRTQFLAMLSALSGAGVLSSDTVTAITALCQQQRHPSVFGATIETVAAARAELARLAALQSLYSQIDLVSAGWRLKLDAIRDVPSAAVPTWAELTAE